MNYKDNECLILEEYTNINEALGKKSFGWLYKSKADLLAFVSKKTRTIIFLPFTQKFKDNYYKIREQTEQKVNKISYDKKGNKWQSAFRVVPFELLKGYISVYKKIN